MESWSFGRMPVRFAVMADIHGNHTALEACLQEAGRRHADGFIFLGDYLGDMAFPEKTLKRLEEIRKAYPCLFIRGNKENYWIEHRRHPEETWTDGSTSTGMLSYNYAHVTADEIDWFEEMPISARVACPGLPELTVCHGSPWKANESMREEHDYIDALTRKLETEITVCGHFHTQVKYQRHGRTVINPGAVGIPLKSGGRAQFMMLEGRDGVWQETFVTLPYDVDAAVRKMDRERLYEQAPGWYRITKQILRGGNTTHVKVLTRASDLYLKESGRREWRNIPETYWNRALDELGIP